MTTTTFPRTIPLRSAWPHRLWAALRGAVAATLEDIRERRRMERELEAALNLSPEMLTDIGAPPGLLLRAQARRDAQRFSRELLHMNDASELRRWM
jgi:hypothetical protein